MGSLTMSNEGVEKRLDAVEAKLETANTDRNENHNSILSRMADGLAALFGIKTELKVHSIYLNQLPIVLNDGTNFNDEPEALREDLSDGKK